MQLTREDILFAIDSGHRQIRDLSSAVEQLRFSDSEQIILLQDSKNQINPLKDTIRQLQHTVAQLEYSANSLTLDFATGDTVKSTTEPYKDRLLLVVRVSRSRVYLQDITDNKIAIFNKSRQELRYAYNHDSPTIRFLDTSTGLQLDKAR